MTPAVREKLTSLEVAANLNPKAPFFKQTFYESDFGNAEPDLTDCSALEQAAKKMFEEVVGENFTVTVRKNYEQRTVELDARTTRRLLGVKKR